MGRRQFRQDLATVTQQPPPHIHDVNTADDGEVSFNYSYTEHGHDKVATIQLLALNIDEYPTDNEYMIFGGNGDVCPKILNAFEIVAPIVRNKTIQSALLEISTCLHQAVTEGHAENPILLPGTSDAETYNSASAAEDYEEDPWLGADDDDDYGFDEPNRPVMVSVGRTKPNSVPAEEKQKIKQELRAAKEAGFKVGVIGDLSTSGIVSISIRVSKLGISEEVMKAWTLQPQQYFVVLIRFLTGYRTLENLMELTKLEGSTEIRVGLSSSYKPNTKSAFDAFHETSVDATQQSQQQQAQSSTDLQPLFIGRPLNDLFRDRFSRILKFRDVYCLLWSGAEQMVHDTQGSKVDYDKIVTYDAMTDAVSHRALPSIVLADALAGQRLKNCSLPLVTMQFALRHFVRCTDFCLVCHCSSGSTFEALKPYVCSSPLCLFQYMALGFGPSIEWEILSQPYVVDLLVSFCYAQAQAGRLKDYPVGIGLRVPILPQNVHGTLSSVPQPRHSMTTARPSISDNTTLSKADFSVPYNPINLELLFPADKISNGQTLKKGDFIAVVNSTEFDGIIYHKIEEIMLPSVRLAQGFHVADMAKDGKKLVRNKVFDADCYLFSHHFDDLSDTMKSKAILTLLDTVPSVKDMLDYLKAHGIGQDSSLRLWRNRISPSALNVLRWIIASNRSCIMQVDRLTVVDGKLVARGDEDRVSGMGDYMQFRFAQGAPDKEQRFVDCVRKQTGSSQYPTLFAWHGSPLHNWHSIIRQGLHFNDTMHGRAFGHGVYMSNTATTSMGFMGGMVHANIDGSGKSGWPNSELKVTGAMSLNEVVNKPDAFVSSSPHYVVANLDWIQTRYLLVKTSASHAKDETVQMDVIPQDPAHTSRGMHGGYIQIPLTAIAKSRRPKSESSRKETKKRKSLGSGRIDEPIEIDDDLESIATMDEDIEYLLDDDSPTGHTPITLDSDVEMTNSDDELDLIASPKKKVRQQSPDNSLELIHGCLLDVKKTSFFPGRLDMSDVQVLPPPADAARSATNSLLKAFRTLIETQSTHAAHELGWYIDPNQVDNMYQWIIELHSFDEDIPLATDMRAADVASVVLEVRFTDEFPFTPPFVRVVKPRFLPFNQGGGGHVTEGGAICMELLTNNGWSAVSSIESVLLQIKLAMSERDRPARLSGSRGHYGAGKTGVYGVGEAIAAYKRACIAHGWTAPKAFDTLQQAGESGYGTR